MIIIKTQKTATITDQTKPTTATTRMSSFTTEFNFSTNPANYELDEHVIKPKLSCKCFNPLCELKYMASILSEKIVRERNFAEYFPDLFLNNVPKHYSISQLHSIFSNYGKDSVVSITIVPEKNTNLVVVRFNEWNISDEVYGTTLCMRWNFYNKTGIPGKIDEICNADIYEFDEIVWKSAPRFGVIYDYSAVCFEEFIKDSRSVYLYNYLICEPYVKMLTEDAELMVNKSQIDYYEKKFIEYAQNNEMEYYKMIETMRDEEIENEEYNQLYNIPLEDGEIDESGGDNDIDEYEEYEAEVAEAISLREKEDDEDDSEMYEYCEIAGVLQRRLRKNPADQGGYKEDPDELHYRINNAKGFANKSYEFWN